jgi:hypothetical protein
MAHRSFTVISVNGKSKSDGGRYISTNPSGAAKKSFNELLRKKSQSKSKSKSKSKKSSVKMVLVLRETTQGSKNKEYCYRVKRVTLKSPRRVELKNGQEIVYRFDTKVEAC